GAVGPFWLPAQYAWTLVSPELYGNPAHNTWWGRGTNYNEMNAYAGLLPLLLGGLALAVIYHATGIGDLVEAVPLLGIARNNRLIFLLQFVLGLLAALGLTALMQ